MRSDHGRRTPFPVAWRSCLSLVSAVVVCGSLIVGSCASTGRAESSTSTGLRGDGPLALGDVTLAGIDNSKPGDTMTVGAVSLVNTSDADVELISIEVLELAGAELIGLGIEPSGVNEDGVTDRWPVPGLLQGDALTGTVVSPDTLMHVVIRMRAVTVPAYARGLRVRYRWRGRLHEATGEVEYPMECDPEQYLC